MKTQFNILIVGGCFPVQQNIATEKLYHQIFKNELEKVFDLSVHTNIVQYEKLYPTLNKIEKAMECKPTDLIIFHIRTEQIIRMIKFYFKYRDQNGNLKKSINISLLGIVNPEKKSCNLYPLPDAINCKIEKSNAIFVNLNYLSGLLILNQYFAFHIYKKLISKIVKLADDKSIDILFTGPVSRPSTFIENRISTCLNNSMERFIKTKTNKPFIRLLGTYENNNYLFWNDNICVNELGHQRIAMILFDSIKNSLAKKIITKSDSILKPGL